MQNPVISNAPRILFVEDEYVIRDVFGQVLELEGYAVSLAEHGQAALALLENGLVPDLILLDLMMPVMDGFEFLKLLRQRPQFLETPVIVVSAFTTMSRSLPPGTGFLEKPVQFAELISSIRKHCPQAKRD